MDTLQSNLVDLGRLKTSVLAGESARPVDGATIRILSRETHRTLEELTTNSSGQTDIVQLPAPPLDYSLEPEDTARPYSEYDLEISASGFETTLIRGVQILPDAEALQNVQLTEQASPTVQLDAISIEEHTLWGHFPPKIPEDEVKELPDAGGFVVLPEPVIPEFIVVHAGLPSDSSAPNYWVPFKDYIKNVGSCEIYATWPENTIQANILAILSFTLNRVYTEWYRGRGYNFTITNSTAYDHAFSYGRNIYSEISVAVDALFTNYITRPGIRQPLLTQYCDGNRVQCPNWMTQWGSMSLGRQGYNTMDILKHYYGYDIYLMVAQQVEGVPSSFPGTPLQVGSSGPAVRTIQTQLNAIARNYPALPTLVVDGVFGQNTRAAVEAYQQIFNLNATGIVDYPTWYAISNTYVAVTRMAELR